MTGPQGLTTMAPGPSEPVDPASPPPPAPPLTAAPWKVRDALALACAAIAVNAGLGALVRWDPVWASLVATSRFLSAATGLDRAGSWALVMALVMVVLYGGLAVPVLIAARRARVPVAAAIGWRAVPTASTLGWGCVTVLGSLVFSTAWGVLLSVLGARIPGNAAELMSRYGRSPAGTVFIVLTAVVLAPVVEEALFRGVLFASLRETWGEGRAAFVSAALFGVIHVEPLVMVQTGVIGYLLAVAFARTGSLRTAVLAHAAFNAVTLAAGMLAASA